MAPKYYFRIDEITESTNARSINYPHFWKPSTIQGHNEISRVGVSYRYWYNSGERIMEVERLPEGASWYKTFSLYYSEGFGFWVYQGDATRPSGGEDWHPLSFTAEPDYSSFLTNAGDCPTLRTQRPDQQWPRMLLPDIYHVPPEYRITDQRYGGLIGELPIFLALLTFSVSRSRVEWVLANCYNNGRWRPHSVANGRVSRRGVVVHVFACPDAYGQTSRSNKRELEALEEGHFGKYFY